MPRRSQTENVRKICSCVKWKACAHPWYLDYRRGGLVLRKNLDALLGRHAPDFQAAVAEARRVIVAAETGRDPCGLLPADDPTVAQLLRAFDHEKPRANRWQIGRLASTAIAAADGRTLPFGEWRARDVTADALRAFRRARPLVAGNRDLALLRAAFNWAVLGGLLPRSPFRVGDVPAVRLAREVARTRRLQPGEEERLLAAAGRLQDLILAALETGCRKGELLSLQWHQVRFSPRAELFLPAQKTKAKRDRRIPISSVLARVLNRRRLDPAGEALPPDAYVFGDEVGRPRRSLKTAWRLTCRRAKVAHLHFHDLRREAGSRWMDAGIPLATIQRWLGHANIAQTSTYLGASLGADELDMRVYEQRVGRLTNVDVFASTDRVEPTPSSTATSEKTQQIATLPDPSGVVH